MSYKASKPATLHKGTLSSHSTSSTPSRHSRHNHPSSGAAASTTPAPPPVFLTLSPSSFTSLILTHHNFFHVSVGRINGRLMALPVVLDCHASLLTGGVMSGSVVLGRLFAHLPTLIADVNVAKLKNVRDKPNLLETDKILFTHQFRETHSKYHIMTIVPPHSSAPRHHYADVDSEADISSDDLRDPDNDNLDSDDDNTTKQHNDDEESGYKGGKYRAFQVSKHSLYIRAIARHREEAAEDGTRREGREEKKQEADEMEEQHEHKEESVSDRKVGRREKDMVDEEEEEEEDSSRRRKRKRDEKSKTDKKSGGRRRSVTVLDDDDDFV